ncbi:MAG: lipopolysaccharide biosynthesis protein, partial [Thermoanaerobaculia bacterium]|nr:lipopolysaccharide biosynthesis protein [Thermoanaerobaculia bacterium]
MSGGATFRAALWAFSATAGTRLVTLVSLAILARLLAPADFGLLAFALVYITYAETVGDLGTAVTLIYWPDRRDDAAQVTFAINLLMGAFWFLLTLLLAPLIADFFNHPEAGEIVRVLSLAFLFKYLGNTHDALAQKDLRFRARAIPELTLASAKALIAIGFALAGFGAWSLVWGHLGGLALWSVAMWLIVPWRPRFYFPRDLFVPMIQYGKGIVGVNVIAAIVHHSDLLIVGRMLGARALGLYQIAYKIPEASVSVILWVTSKVLFPAFSKIEQAGEGLRSAYLEALRYVSFVTIPMAAGLFVSAEQLVLVFFGSKWSESIPLLQWLAVYAGLRSLGTHAGDVMKATGRSSLLFGLGVVKGAILIPALIFAG